MAKSAKDYINDGDFEGALVRYETANFRWKEHWWDTLVEIYKNFKKWTKKYILDFKNKIVQIGEAITGIVYKINTLFDRGVKVCYLFKFWDSCGDIVFSKVGTTEVSVQSRATKELREYQKKFDVVGVSVESAIDCGDVDPEGAESYCRAKFIRKYPGTYLKNDRFLGVNIPVEDFNNLVADYLA